ncbi:NmrA family NAD(P)-binding protein [Streptomyces sp. NPDC005494]|uniref:NmrA family NAD(P)-binding protein n=1 Tax=Streptomyces sp. NPDC005494 TaxID=3364715 RepID=UPI003697A472
MEVFVIVVTTPTGDIGGQVLDRLLNSGEAVRVIARDSSRLPERVQAHVEVIEGSHSDAGTITKALEGAHSLFWLVPPAGPDNAETARRYYLQFAQAAGREAARHDVRVVGVTSLGHGYPGEAGLLSAALATDEVFENSGAPYRALALPFFMENLLRQAPVMKEQGAFSMANAAGRPLPIVATRDVAASAATLLMDTTWHGQARIPLVSPDDLTPDTMAEVISEVLGHTVHYHQVPLADFQAAMAQRGMSRTAVQDFASMVAAQNNGIYEAEPRGTASVTATGFRQWCKEVLKPAAQA